MYRLKVARDHPPLLRPQDLSDSRFRLHASEVQILFCLDVKQAFIRSEFESDIKLSSPESCGPYSSWKISVGTIPEDTTYSKDKDVRAVSAGSTYFSMSLYMTPFR